MSTSHFKLHRTDQDETMKSAFSLHEIEPQQNQLPEDSPVILQDHTIETDGVIHTGFVSPVHTSNMKHDN